MTLEQTTRDDFRIAIQEAVKDALMEIAAAAEEKRYFSREYNWPTLSWTRANGMPLLWTTSSEAPLSYASVFSPLPGEVEPKGDPSDQMPSFDRLQEMIFDDGFLRQRLLGYDEIPEDDPVGYGRFGARYMPKAIAGRYVSLWETTTFEEAKFTKIDKQAARQVIEEEEEFRAESAQKTNRGRGRPSKAASEKVIAERIGRSRGAIRNAEKHVVAAERYPFLQNGEWKQKPRDGGDGVSR